jgi:hypothetical protein
MPLHKQIFLTFRLIAGLQRAVNVPRPVNLNVVNPLLQNRVSLTFIPINVSVHQLNHLAAAKLHQHAANLPVNCVAGSRNAAAQILAVPRITAVLQLQRMTAAPQLQKPVVLLLPKHVPLQLLKLAVHQPLKPAVLLLLKHVPLQLPRPAVLLLPKLAVHQPPRPVLLLLQTAAATNNPAATQILAKSLN